MKADTNEVNPAFQSIIQNPDQKVFLDANFFIPPDRSNVAKVKAYSFNDFKECWLIPLLNEFAGVAIHESVYDELVADSVKNFADEQKDENPPKITVHYDSELRSLSFMAVKQFLFFAANDALPVRLIKDAAKLRTGLDNMQVVQMYELIYYLYKTNPEWGSFIKQMDLLYNKMF